MTGRAATRRPRPAVPGAEPWGVGTDRPVYFWAGAASARFQQAKFPGSTADEVAHLDGVRAAGLERLRAAGFNWAFLAASWGFPPEVEADDWADFARAARLARTRGIRAFAYIQASNAFATGSYADRDWYAVTPEGRRIPYYAGRFMTCLNHPDWRAEVAERIRGLADAGADGLYFDNVWMGATPWVLGPTYGGFAGCACARCRSEYRTAEGAEIPRRIDPEDPDAPRYLRWRADLVTRRLREWVELARSCRPTILTSANACAAVLRHAYVLFGIDYAAWSRFLDVVLVEDVALPEYRRHGRRSFSQAAVTAKAARAAAAPTPVATVSYDRGIGLDGAADSRRLRQALAEAAACDAVGVVKGAEYLDPEGRFTVLTAPAFASARETCGEVLGWLAEHAGLYRDRQPAAALGLLYPYDEAAERWECWAPSFFGAATALLVHGLPFRIVTAGQLRSVRDDPNGPAILLAAGDSGEAALRSDLDRAAGSCRVVRLPDGFWSPPFSARPPATVATRRRRRWLSPLLTTAQYAYFTHPTFQRLMHRTGLVDVGMRPPYFRVPRNAGRLLERLGPVPGPRARAAVPVLVEHWRAGRVDQLHLVNYGPTPERVTLTPHLPESLEMMSPDGPVDWRRTPEGIELRLDTYAVVLWKAGSS